MSTMNPLDPTPSEVEEARPSAAEALEKLLDVAGATSEDARTKLKEKLAKFSPPTEKKTGSGAEAVDDTPPAPAAAPQRALTGRDVDWSEYDLDFGVAHLYHDAVYRETPQGPKWVAMMPDFYSTTRDFKNHGKKANVPGTSDGTETEELNLGMYLKDMVCGREQWKIAAVMPAGNGQCGLLLERQVPVILPDPTRLKTTEEVAAPTNPDLKAVEDAALAFMANEGLKPIERGSAAHEEAVAQLDEDGALPARIEKSAVRGALELNRAEQVAAPQGKGQQPSAVENPLIDDVTPAAGYAAAQDILRALNDPKFRASLPTED